MTVVKNWMGELPGILAGVDEKDIYNFDETGLFLRRASNRVVSLVRYGRFQESLHYLVVLFHDRKRMKPMLIAKSNNPRALKGAGLNRISVLYRSQKKALMVGDLFDEWLHEFDKDFGKADDNRSPVTY